MLATKGSTLCSSEGQLCPWMLGIGWRCGSHFPGVPCTHQLPQPQDFLLVPAQRNQVKIIYLAVDHLPYHSSGPLPFSSPAQVLVHVLLQL